MNYIKNNNSTTWYNYDAFGRSLATITQVTEADFLAKRPAIDDQVKTVQSDYNYFNGLVYNTTYQVNSAAEGLKYTFAYDANYRNTNTQLKYGATTENLGTTVYTKMGQVKRAVLGNNYQGIDYIYTLNGGLKAINNPALDYLVDPGHDNDDYTGASGNTGVNKDLFGEIIEYYKNDYESYNSSLNSTTILNSRYNGLIYGVRFKTRNSVNGQTINSNSIDKGLSQDLIINSSAAYEAQELRFGYTYDELNRLGKTAFGKYYNTTGVFFGRPEYSETGAAAANISYDRNGNLTALLRNAYADGSGNAIKLDDLTYTNGSTNNKLTAIVDAATSSAFQSSNFYTPSTSSSAAFTYNSIGQMVSSVAEKISNIVYFPTGKIKQILFTNGNSSTFEYGAGGEKLKAKFYIGSTGKSKYTWYVGPYTYEYDDAVAVFRLTEAKVAGGMVRVPSGTSVGTGYMVYQLSDHLGNVRATFKGSGTGNGITILSYTDYYAFGGPLPGRNWQAEGYRYGYQGQEKAQDNTLWDQFELRAYNHDIGRWTAPDPKDQFASPYIAMANNPVSNIDPDGGQVPLFDPNHLPRGMVERDREKSSQSGAYSITEVLKRYKDEYDNIRKHDLNGNPVYDGGTRGNVDQYLKDIYALNEFYGGLVQAANWGASSGMEYGSGTEYLTQIEIGNNVMACQRNGSQAMSMSMTSIKEFKMQAMNREPNSQELWASAKREGLDGPRGAQITGRQGKVADPEPVIEVEAPTTFDKEGEEDDKKAAGKDATKEEDESSGSEQTPNYQGPIIVQNTGKKDSWLKPENNNEAPVLLKAGQKTAMNIDGATHPDFPGQVFKVIGISNIIGITINDNGIFINSQGGNIINSIKGGWKDQSWLDERHVKGDFGWDAIFQRSNQP